MSTTYVVLVGAMPLGRHALFSTAIQEAKAHGDDASVIMEVRSPDSLTRIGVWPPDLHYRQVIRADGQEP